MGLFFVLIVVIEYNSRINEYKTIDNIMKVIPFIGEKIIQVVPRFFPDVDSEVIIELRSEINDTIHYPIFDYTVSTNTINITFEDNSVIFKNNMKYVLTIIDDNEIVYIGKIVCLEDVDQEFIQNFKTAEITNGKIKF